MDKDDWSQAAPVALDSKQSLARLYFQALEKVYFTLDQSSGDL